MSIGSPDFLGIPAIDRIAALISESGYTLSYPSTYSSSVVNVSAYQSLLISYTDTNALYTGTTTRLIRVRFYADSATTIFLGEYSWRVCVQGGQLQAKVPTLGPYMMVTVGSSAATSDSVLTLHMYGSHRAVTVSRAELLNTVTETASQYTASIGGLLQYSNTLASGTTVYGYPNHFEGPAHVHITVGPVSSVFVGLSIYDITNSQPIDEKFFFTSTSSQPYSFNTFLPGVPIILKISNADSASNTYYLAITQDGAFR